MITVTPQAPSENAVLNATQTNVQVVASSDAGTITSVSLSINGGSALALAFDSTLGAWKKTVAIPLGAVTAKILVTDSTAATKAIYINFSRSVSTNAPAIISISHPAPEGVTVRSPGVILQADINRPSDIVRVEASVDQGQSWVPMAIPVSLGGS
ncbi:MAG TPA: Ig-like domain-containing protein [Nitrospiraceae bacterium]